MSSSTVPRVPSLARTGQIAQARSCTGLDCGGWQARCSQLLNRRGRAVKLLLSGLFMRQAACIIPPRTCAGSQIIPALVAWSTLMLPSILICLSQTGAHACRRQESLPPPCVISLQLSARVVRSPGAAPGRAVSHLEQAAPCAHSRHRWRAPRRACTSCSLPRARTPHRARLPLPRTSSCSRSCGSRGPQGRTAPSPWAKTLSRPWLHRSPARSRSPQRLSQ